jgi:pyruvate ferredoxin oxidoreductase delta subunit
MGNEKWHEINPGLYIDKPGSSKQNKTGSWRTFRPVTDKKKCIKCAICWLFCPDNSRIMVENGYYDVNRIYCKGCGICAEECPTDAIEMVMEEW